MRGGGWERRNDAIICGGGERIHREDVDRTQRRVGLEKVTLLSGQGQAVQVRAPQILIGRSPAQGDIETRKTDEFPKGSWGQEDRG